MHYDLLNGGLTIAIGLQGDVQWHWNFHHRHGVGNLIFVLQQDEEEW
jgi:hypothetical protein